MYVSYLLDKDGSVYPNAGRPPAFNLSPQGFAPGPPGPAGPPAPPYPDFPAYHHHDNQGGGGGGAAWSPGDWAHYGAGHAPNPGHLGCFGPPEFPPGVQAAPGAGAGPGMGAGPGAAEARRNPYEWMRRNAAHLNPGGKTRTKDKYRVVYTDHQRLELEKEFHYSRYITIRRKAELAAALSLSERQVKIWFQNRRAKERKMTKKKLQQPQAASSTTNTTPTPPGGGGGGGGGGGHPLVSSSVSSSVSMTIKEEF